MSSSTGLNPIVIKISKDMLLAGIKYSNYVKHVVDSPTTPIDKQCLLYEYLSALSLLYKDEFANLFSLPKKKELIQLNNDYYSLVTKLDGLDDKVLETLKKANIDFIKSVNTDLTDKNNYMTRYKLTNKDIRQLQTISDELLFNTLVVIMDEQINNINNKRYGITSYTGKTTALSKSILGNIFGLKQTTKTDTEDFKNMSSFINSLSNMTAGLMTIDIGEASRFYNILKMELIILGTNNIYYTKVNEIERLGDMITLKKNKQLQAYNKLSGRSFDFSNGRLERVELAPIGKKVVSKLKTLDRFGKLKYPNNVNKLNKEVMQMTDKKDITIIDYILSDGQKTTTLIDYKNNFNNIPYKITNQILVKFLEIPIQQRRPISASFQKQQQRNASTTTQNPQQRNVSTTTQNPQQRNASTIQQQQLHKRLQQQYKNLNINQSLISQTSAASNSAIRNNVLQYLKNNTDATDKFMSNRPYTPEQFMKQLIQTRKKLQKQATPSRVSPLPIQNGTLNQNGVNPLVSRNLIKTLQNKTNNNQQ